MAYDEGLAQRIREQLDRPSIAERRMFGGLAFMLRGNLCVGVLGDDMIARVGPDAYGEALAEPGARVFDFTGRPSKGIVVVDGTSIEHDATLAGWIERAVRFAGSLPAKAPGMRSKKGGRQK